MIMSARLLVVAAFAVIALDQVRPAMGQDKKSAKKAADPKEEALRRTLDLSVKARDFETPMTCKEFMDLLKEKVAATGQTLPIVIEEQAFAEKKIGLVDVLNSQIRPLPVTEA